MKNAPEIKHMYVRVPWQDFDTFQYVNCLVSPFRHFVFFGEIRGRMSGRLQKTCFLRLPPYGDHSKYFSTESLIEMFVHCSKIKCRVLFDVRGHLTLYIDPRLMY